MANKVQMRRLAWLALLLTAAFAGLGYRLVDLQVLRHEEFATKVEERTQHQVVLEPRRGDILDIKGNILATSVGVKTVCADPVFIGSRQAEVAHALAPLLLESESSLAERLTPRVVRLNEQGQPVTNEYVVLKRKVPLEAWDQIQATMKDLQFKDEPTLSASERKQLRWLRQKSIFAEDDQLRVYPNHTLAAHVLGYVGMDGNGEEMSGKDGIELVFNPKLAGVRGWRVTETDRQRREILSRREQDVEARDGLNVVLTLDSVIQNIVESALKEGMEKYTPVSICGIVARPKTGEILAMATLPNYDPNNRQGLSESWRNRVITDLAEPGSTFKIVPVSAALNENVVKLTDTFDCEHGHFYFGGRTLHDHESYGVLSAQEIITKSSNIGAAKIGIKLGEDRLYQYIREFGFGDRTGIPLPAEASGSNYVRPPRFWKKVTLAQIPMGHGIAVTRLQMLMAMCAIANNGVLMRPMLVERLEDADHKLVAKYTPQKIRQVLNETAVKDIVKALKTVPTRDGTAPKAALEHYLVAGKTGTAMKIENGHYVAKYFSSFIGFFPADNPELCISVTLDEPRGGHYGGEVAAPIFKEIAQRSANYLGIRPEEVESGSIQAAMAAPDHSIKTAARARAEND